MTSHADYALQRIVAKAWDAVVGPDVGTVTLVTGCTDGTLTVLTPSAAWVEKLEPMTAGLMERLNHALLSPGAITGIKWSQGIPKEKDTA